MTRLLLLCAVLAAGCETERELRILLGPAEGTLSRGFSCIGANGRPLLEDAVVAGTVRANLVIDVIDVGSRLPGCRGESLLRACEDGTCRLAPTSPRFCVPFTLPLSLLAERDEAAVVAELQRQVATGPAIEPPDRPVIVRAVITTQPCDALGTSALDPVRAAGCAYSCPFVPDSLDGPIALEAETLDDRCEDFVRLCAGFGAPL